MRSGLTDDFRLHDVGDAVNLGGGVLIHLGHAEGFRESEDVQEFDGVSTVLPLYQVQVDDLLLVLQLVVLDVGASSAQSSLYRFEEVRESLSLVIIVLIYFPFLAIILLLADTDNA
jgi:hypothetical protein